MRPTGTDGLARSYCFAPFLCRLPPVMEICNTFNSHFPLRFGVQAVEWQKMNVDYVRDAVMRQKITPEVWGRANIRIWNVTLLSAPAHTHSSLFNPFATLGVGKILKVLHHSQRFALFPLDQIKWCFFSCGRSLFLSFLLFPAPTRTCVMCSESRTSWQFLWSKHDFSAVTIFIPAVVLPVFNEIRSACWYLYAKAKYKSDWIFSQVQ